MQYMMKLAYPCCSAQKSISLAVAPRDPGVKRSSRCSHHSSSRATNMFFTSLGWTTPGVHPEGRMYFSPGLFLRHDLVDAEVLQPLQGLLLGLGQQRGVDATLLVVEVVVAEVLCCLRGPLGLVEH